jgi:ABC-type phosphate transport system ATPase subunit
MPTPFRAQIYRDVAHLLREQAAASTPEIQKEMEATARQYDLLAESVEISNSEAVTVSGKPY